jgi:sugar lactone lactonase YvrE
MNPRLQKQVNPKVAAVLILAALVAVQWFWFKGLVYREPGTGPGGGGGSPIPPGSTTINGRADIWVDTIAGEVQPGDTDGPGHAARFDRPTGLAIDAGGVVYVADTGNHRIRKILSNGQTTTLAGGAAGYADGPTQTARFNAPCGVTVAPDGAIYVADTGNHCLRKIHAGQVTTLAGTPTEQGESAIPPIESKNSLALPASIAYVADTPPYLLVADSGNKRVCKYGLNGALVGQQAVVSAPTAVAGTPQIAAAVLPQSGTLLLGTQTFRNLAFGASEIPFEAQMLAPLVGGRRGRPLPVGGRWLGTGNASGSGVPRRGEKTPPSPPGAFVLHHPVALWPVGNGWLATDSDYAAIFLIREGKGEVLAGYCSSGGAIRGWRDSDGSRASFGVPNGIVADDKGHIYVADTANNNIRRLTLPGGGGI